MLQYTMINQEELIIYDQVNNWVGQAAFNRYSGVENRHLTEAHEVLQTYLKIALRGVASNMITQTLMGAHGGDIFAAKKGIETMPNPDFEGPGHFGEPLPPFGIT